MRMPHHLRFLVILVGLLATGCLQDISAEATRQRRLAFGPDHPSTTLTVYNPGPSPIRLQSLRFEGKDWDAFKVGNEHIQELVPGNGEVELDVATSPKVFELPGKKHEHRFGLAQLSYSVDLIDYKIPITFYPSSESEKSPWQSLLFLSPLALVTCFFVWLVSRRVVRRRKAEPQPAVPSVLWVLLLVSFALIPIGNAWCFDLTGEAVDNATLHQCSKGLGGFPLALARSSYALPFIALTCTLAWLYDAHRRRMPPPTAAAILFGLGSLSTSIGAGSFDLHGLVTAQLQTSSIAATLPSWGIFEHPIGAIVSLAAIIHVARANHRIQQPTDSYTQLCETLSVLVVVTLFLGSWALPLSRYGASEFGGANLFLSQPVNIVICIATLGIKTATVQVVVRWVSKRV